MLKRTIQQQRDQRAIASRRRCLSRLKVAVAMLCLVSLLFVFLREKTEHSSSELSSADSQQSLTADRLAKLNNIQLDAIDIATRNFICGMDIIEETISENTLHERIDSMVQRVKVETERNYHRYSSKPDDYENSEAYYKMLMLVTVL